MNGASKYDFGVTSRGSPSIAAMSFSSFTAKQRPFTQFQPEPQYRYGWPSLSMKASASIMW